MSGLGRTFRIERAQREGFSAWTVGQVEKAIEQLELVLAERPGAVEAIFPLARAYSENDQPERALELLERAAADREVRDAASVYRGLVLYDQDDAIGAREALDRLPAENSLAAAIRCLLDVRSGSRPASSFSPEQLWLADVAGRLLAILEERHAERDAAAVDRLHHRLWVAGDADDEARPGAGADDDTTVAASPGGKGVGEEQASETCSVSFDGERAWQKSIDRLFELGRFEDLVRANDDRRVGDSWRDEVTNLLHGFALVATGNPKKARRELTGLLAAHATNADLHFILGLAEVRCGERRRASWEFVRAARLADIQVHRVLSALLERESSPPTESRGQVPKSSL